MPETTENAMPTLPVENEDVRIGNENSADKVVLPNKKLAFKYFLYALIAFSGIYAVQFFHFIELLFQPVYRGNLSTVIYCVITVVFWFPFIAVLHKSATKRLGYKLFNRSNPRLSFKRACIIYACVIVPVIIISACLKFEFKVVHDLNRNLMQMQIIKTASLYAQGSIELVLALVFAELVQEGAELLYKGKYASVIPWGGFALAFIYAPIEIIIAYATGANVLFAWLNIAFFFLYGIIFILSKKNFSVTLLSAILIYLL